jgi:hypothetical protein
VTTAPKWIPENVWAKLDTPLQREIVAVHGDSAVALPVMIVVGSSSPMLSSGPFTDSSERDAAVTRARAAFDREAQPVLDRLAAAGARDLRTFWINHTIAARLSLSALISVASLPGVRNLLLDSRRSVLL